MINKNIPKSRLAIGLILIFLVSIVLLITIDHNNDIFELKITDTKFHFRNRYLRNPKISNSVFNLSLDDYSFKKEKDWNRNKIGILLEKLSTANTAITGCDFMIANYRKESDDEKLIDSFKYAGNVISPIILTQDIHNEFFNNVQTQFAKIDDLSQFIEVGIFPIKEILDYSIGYGFVNIKQDADGIVRRYPLIVRHDNMLLPSFALALLAAYFDYDLNDQA